MKTFKKSTIGKGISISLENDGIPYEINGLSHYEFIDFINKRVMMFDKSKVVLYKAKNHDSTNISCYLKFAGGVNTLKYCLVDNKTRLDIEQGLITDHGLTEEQKEKIKNHSFQDCYAIKVNPDFVTK